LCAVVEPARQLETSHPLLRCEFGPHLRKLNLSDDATDVDFTVRHSRVKASWRHHGEGIALVVRGLPLASYAVESSRLS
jgi:hypothetical protein